MVQGLIYQSGSGIADLVPKIGSFGSATFSEMLNPFPNLNPECGGSSSPNTTEKRKAHHPQFKPIMVLSLQKKKDLEKLNLDPV